MFYTIVNKKNSIFSNLIRYYPLLEFGPIQGIMDKFKISYICHKKPDKWIHLDGFEMGQKYWGRAFNDLFEVSPLWGSDTPTKIISRKTFASYFELVD